MAIISLKGLDLTSTIIDTGRCIRPLLNENRCEFEYKTMRVRISCISIGRLLIPTWGGRRDSLNMNRCEMKMKNLVISFDS